MSILPAKPGADPTSAEELREFENLSEFMLSITPPYSVVLVTEPEQQTQPSKTQAELLADGQCEV